MQIKSGPKDVPVTSQAHRHWKQKRKPHSGYVLMTVIAVSILVITCLSLLARQSLSLGLKAADQERMLQKRWGSLTLQRTLLVNAERIFERLEEKNRRQGNGTPPVIRSKLVLGEVAFDLLLADEDAKLPLNTLYHYVGLKKTEDSINRVAGSNATLATRLIPAVEPMQISREKQRATASDDEENEVTEDVPDAFRSWGEVFDLATLGKGSGNKTSLQASTTNLTCWGSGQLNFRRASDKAILALAQVVVQDGKARRVLQRYRASPTASLSTLLLGEVSDQQKQRQLQTIFSETSTNFSIWIDAHSRSGPPLTTFTVMKRDADGVVKQQRFSL
ncbi:MAG TPA: hypothetical protein DEF45_14015 [Rhodopirellula sp.]|nr:hypothetical protein [Rhodopirellula sp.]